MKNKHLILTTVCALLCILGCSCSKEPQKDNSSSSTSESSKQESVVEEEKIERISINQSSVTFCVGESFTLIAEAEGVANAEFSWAIDGDADGEVVSLAVGGNTAVITALKAGQTKLVASVQEGENTYFKTVEVTVKEAESVSFVVSENVGFDNEGYHAELWTLPTAEGETSITPIVSAYKNNKLLPNVAFTWVSENTDVVKTEEGKLVAVSEGQTRVVGSCEVDGKAYTLAISVSVERPIVLLKESFTIETDNLTTLSITSTINGVVREVSYNGKTVGAYDAQKKTITLQKSKLPTLSAEMGEDRALFIETNLARYQINVNLYTKILMTVEDFDTFSVLAKSAYPDSDAIWDGYFVLGNDIVYNGLYQSQLADIGSLWAAVEGSWSNGGLYGFKGVFDGKGHIIDGVSIDNGNEVGSVFGVLHIDGVVKNVSFTNASVAANGSFVCSAGGGTVENVYVQYASMGKGAQRYEGDGSVNFYCSTFFGFKEPTSTANISNCVVDVTKTSFNMASAIKIVGSEYVSIKNVFVIGGTNELRSNSNATMAFPAMIDFVENVTVQGRYKKFSEEFWAISDGAPIPNAVYEKVQNATINFTETVSYLVSGTSYQLVLDNSYVKWSADNNGVEIKSGVATISPSIEGGEKVTITATSLFDETKTASFTCTLAKVDKGSYVDLTVEAETAFYDWTLNKVYFADLSSKVVGEALYFVDDTFASASFVKDGDGAQTLYAVTKDAFYKFNCISVTKVIEKAEDLHYIRRDYTVSSYDNPGCYDGKLTGTFVLINDIDCTGLTLKNSGRYWENSRGFNGVFDGRGHTISNLSVGENGLFGAITHATIKDVNFVGVRLTEVSYVSLFANRMFNTTVENVTMQFATYFPGNGLFCGEASFDCIFRNVTIDISNVNNVAYVTENDYDTETPYLSKSKSVYENVTLIWSGVGELPKFAYNDRVENDYVEYPDGFTIVTKGQK